MGVDQGALWQVLMQMIGSDPKLRTALAGGGTAANAMMDQQFGIMSGTADPTVGAYMPNTDAYPDALNDVMPYVNSPDEKLQKLGQGLLGGTVTMPDVMNQLMESNAQLDPSTAAQLAQHLISQVGDNNTKKAEWLAKQAADNATALANTPEAKAGAPQRTESWFAGFDPTTGEFSTNFTPELVPDGGLKAFQTQSAKQAMYDRFLQDNQGYVDPRKRSAAAQHAPAVAAEGKAGAADGAYAARGEVSPREVEAMAKSLAKYGGTDRYNTIDLGALRKAGADGLTDDEYNKLVLPNEKRERYSIMRDGRQAFRDAIARQKNASMSAGMSAYNSAAQSGANQPSSAAGDKLFREALQAKHAADFAKGQMATRAKQLASQGRTPFTDWQTATTNAYMGR